MLCIAYLGRGVRTDAASGRRRRRPQVTSIYLASHLSLLLFVCGVGDALGQVAGDLLRPGEAYVTRFSGTSIAQGPNGRPVPVINTAGTVGSIVDIRSPRRPPHGEHWYDEPQRRPVTAGEVGQVFGVVLDDSQPPNIYLSATSAFGLHLAPGTTQWMDGLWGAGGGPGTIYRLSRENGYRPSVFANITLGDRQNTGAALGNMAYDRTNKQLFVSDLETGMIHRLRASDGTDLGFYDHGVIGRANFFDGENNVAGNLPPIMFTPDSAARIADCPSGNFERSPQCWNFSPSGRRVWGLGARTDVSTNETRLFYAVWSSPSLGNGRAWNAASDDDKRNAVWSIRLGPGGNFDISDIRREFMLPDFFVQRNDITRAGFSQPVSDITFSNCSDRPVMLIAERGGIRNLGLAADNPFAFPHEARSLRYELDTSGVWRPVGRYDVGYYDRKNDGQPFLRANCAGGIAFAPGYTSNYTIDLAKPDQFVWMTGDYLCSPEAPCHLPPVPQEAGVQQVSDQVEQDGDDSHVHGAQGLAEGAFDELVPVAALSTYPSGEGQPYPASGPDQSYLIDTDINVDAAGNLIEAELRRNDATKIGDIAIYEVCVPRRQTAFMSPPPPDTPLDVTPPYIVGHERGRSHFLVASHQVAMSHYRFGSHNPYWSHNRFRSHHAEWSHSRTGSHSPRWSHSHRASHSTAASHPNNPPPTSHHLLAISRHTPPSKTPPPKTPPPPPNTATNHGGGGTATNQGGGGAATNHGGGGGVENGGTCSTVNGKTTCTSTPPSTATQTATKTHLAAISRQGGGHPSGPTPPGTNTTHQPTATNTTHTTTSAPSHVSPTTTHSSVPTHTTTHAAAHVTTHTASHTHTAAHVSRSSFGHSHAVSHVSRGGGFRGGGGHRGGGGGGHGRRSDIRLKGDITPLGQLANGIGIYRFRYMGGDSTAYVGVMAQEVQAVMPSAVTRGADGYLRVQYERLGIEFMTWDAWRRMHRLPASGTSKDAMAPAGASGDRTD
jgi:Chaperone of endosialidase